MKKQFNKNTLAVAVGLTAVFSACLSGAAMAADSQAKRQRGALEEVVVTATKRSESVQNIPVAVSAFSADALNMRGIESPLDLQQSVPGLVLAEGHSGVADVTLRGVGNKAASDSGGNPAVPIYADGHYLQFTPYMLKDFFDVERVEVLRGPQGTLYGRNAVGGSINIITNRPTEDVEFQLGVELGNYEKKKLTGIVSGPLTDKLRARLSFVGEKRDGYVENISNGQDLLDSDYTTARASIVYDITDDIELFVSGFSYRDDSKSSVTRIVGEYPDAPGTAFALLTEPNPTANDPQKIASDVEHSGNDDADGISVDVTWNLGGATLKSLTAYNDAEKEVINDLDASPLMVFSYQRFGFESETLSQEFQLVSREGSALKWVAGLYYYEENSSFVYDLPFVFNGWIASPDFVNGAPADSLYLGETDYEIDSIAAYGQLDYAFSEVWSVTAGLRYTEDKQERQTGVIFDTPLFRFELPAENDESWSEPTGKIGVNYHASDSVMLYASYSKGFKAGGIGGSNAEPYDPEILDAYEVGMKGEFFENRLRLNIASFYYDYTDKLESVLLIDPITNAGSRSYANAGKASVAGIEIEAQAYLTDAFKVDASLGYQKGEYEEFISADPSNEAAGNQDLSGNQLTFTPDLKVYIGAEYTLTLAEGLGAITARVDYSWTDDQYYRPYNLESDQQEAYHRTNARIRWQSTDSKWTAEVYGLNLEDDDIFSNLTIASETEGFAPLGTYFPPRTYGAKLTYRF